MSDVTRHNFLVLTSIIGGMTALSTSAVFVLICRSGRLDASDFDAVFDTVLFAAVIGLFVGVILGGVSYPFTGALLESTVLHRSVPWVYGISLGPVLLSAVVLPQTAAPFLTAPIAFFTVFIVAHFAEHRFKSPALCATLCPECDYDLSGCVTPGCPECGRGRDDVKSTTG